MQYLSVYRVLSQVIYVILLLPRAQWQIYNSSQTPDSGGKV